MRSIEYSYDAADQVVQAKDSHGGLSAYSYDAAGRLTEVCYDACKDFIRYGYDGSGNPLWERRPDGRTTIYQTGAGSYHWDTEMTRGLTHSHTPHLQVHESNGTIIRIFYGG